MINLDTLPPTPSNLLETKEADYTLYINDNTNKQGVGERLDKYLAQNLPFSRNLLQQWLEQGAILVNQQIKNRSYKLKNDDQVEIFKQALPSELAFSAENLPLNIIFEDEDLIIIHKPIDLVCHPAPGNWHGTLLNAILHHFPENHQLPRAGLVHRLDKMTSGVMVIAKHLASYYYLTDQLQNRWFKRDYLALVQGVPANNGVVDAPILRHPQQKIKMKVANPQFLHEMAQAKPALTYYQRLASIDFFELLAGWVTRPMPEPATELQNSHQNSQQDSQQLSAQYLSSLPHKHQHYSLMHCRLATGRTHQIRLHMAHLGHGLVGDVLYHHNIFSPEVLIKLKQIPQHKFSVDDDLFFNQQRQALHAASLALVLPKFAQENRLSDLQNNIITPATEQRLNAQISQQNALKPNDKPDKHWFEIFEHYQAFQAMPEDALMQNLLSLDKLQQSLNCIVASNILSR